MDPGSSLSTANVARSLRGPLILMALVFAAAPAHAQMPEVETSEMAYVSAQARGPGKRGEVMHPFSSLQQALAAGARELRIEPGFYPEEQLALGGGGTVTLRRWDPHARDASAVTIRGAVTIDDATTVILDAGGEAFHFLGDLLLHDGILELRSTTLTMGTLEGTAHTLFVGKNSRLLGSNPCARNLIRFTGGDTTHVFIETTEARLHFDFPCIEIEKDETGVVTFDASGVPATTVPPDPPDRLDVLATPRFTLISAADSAGVRLRDGLDLLDVVRNYRQRDGGLSTAHLIEQGFTRIGYVGTPPGNKLSDVREAGYRRAMAEHGLAIDPAWLAYTLEGPSWDRYEAGYAHGLRLGHQPDRPKALFVYNDVSALGVQRGLLESGLKIPDDVALVGFDDIERVALAPVPMTSVKQTTDEISRLAVESLLKRIRGQSVEPYITLQPELVVRASSLKPSAGDGLTVPPTPSPPALSGPPDSPRFSPLPLCGDVLEVDPAKDRRDPPDGLDDLVGILGVEADREGVDIDEFF